MITRKIKIGEFFYYYSHSIQNIAHHSQSLFDGVISEGGGVCMSFVNKPMRVLVHYSGPDNQIVEEAPHGIRKWNDNPHFRTVPSVVQRLKNSTGKARSNIPDIHVQKNMKIF